MHWFSRAKPLVTLLAAACVLTPAPEQALTAGTQLVVRSVSVVDPDRGTASAPQDVFIDQSRIAQIAPAGALSVPQSTRELDGTGRFLIPGLIDVHAHVGEGGVAAQHDSTRQRALAQFLRYGVTSIFVPGATGASDADFPRLRERCRPRTIACPELFGTGSLITAPGSHPVSTIFRMPPNVPPQVTEARGVTMLQPNADIDALIAAKAAAGVNAIKIIVEDGPPSWYPKPRLSDDQVRAIVRAAKARSLPVFAHISTARLTRVAVDAGVDGIMHSPTDPLPDDLIRRMAQRGTWYVPTLALYDGLLTWARKQRESDPYALKGVEPSAIESLATPAFLAASAADEAQASVFLANAAGNLRRVVAAGVPLALGTDVNNPFVFPGYSVHEEMTLLVRAGLTAAQALRAATLGSAAFLRASHRIGRIAPGQDADLVLLARNPLERIENSRTIVAVVADGQLVPNPVSSH